MSETVTLYKCDKCKKIINEPTGGLVIHGNIYVADPTQRGGLIGNNFPKKGERFETEDAVARTVLCVPCFLNAVLPDVNLSGGECGLFDRAFHC